MTETASTESGPVERIDLTSPSGGRLIYLEILTDAGIVRVNTNLVDTRTGQPCVVVEVEPNTAYRQWTAPGGDWETEIREPGILSRTDVRLTKREGT